MINWYAVLVPANTPRAVVAKLNGELNRILNLSPSIVSKTKRLVLDCLGNQIGAVDEEAARLLHEVLEVAQIRGKSTVVGFGDQTSVATAACMNGMLAHALDMDDAHRDLH